MLRDKTILSLSFTVSLVLLTVSVTNAQECPCDCDANGSGECTPMDILTVINCINDTVTCPECSCCQGGTQGGCNVNCDEVVDCLDIDAIACRIDGGGTECCDDAQCPGACCFRIDGINYCSVMRQTGCEVFGGKYLGDGTTCAGGCPNQVPTVSEWGLVATTLLVLAAGSVVFARRGRLDRA